MDNKTLHILTTAALVLPGITFDTQAALPVEKPELDSQYAHYQEGSDRISVDVYQGSATIPIAQVAEVSVNWVVDIFSGATPVLTMPKPVAHVVSGASIVGVVNSNQQFTNETESVQVMTGASTREIRYGLDIDELTLHASGGRSEEPDYLSYAYNLGIDWEFNKKLTSLSLGFGQNFDEIKPSTRTFSKQKTGYQWQLGISQVLNKISLLKLSFNYSLNMGYLSNPYKKVFIQNLPTSSDFESGGFNQVYYENRPEERHLGSVSLAYTHYFSKWDSAFHFDYRYYRDSWNINSHTITAALHQPIADGWMLVPKVRYYSQSKAGFYKLFFISSRADNHYSSDYRLAGFGSVGTGIKLSKNIKQETGFISSMKFQVGFEYTFHAADLKIGNKQGVDLTDFNYFLTTVSFKIEF